MIGNDQMQNIVQNKKILAYQVGRTTQREQITTDHGTLNPP